jgi:CheY-like chemotaxis protein/anti-sigma regulatory factor (Ser/Thr protein kinase)
MNQECIQQVQKINAIGVLAGGIAHDFNNILSIIFGYTELSIRKVDPNSDIANDLNNVILAATRGRELVRQILCFSRRSDDKLIPLQLSTSVKEILKMIRASIPATIEIVQEINEDKNLVYADPTRIHQLIVNLCVNAHQAMEHTGGKLTVTLEKVIFPQDNQGCSRLEDFLRLSIRDTGVGIDPAIKEKIFEPYFTTKEPDRGSGMGLAIVYEIVVECGGYVNVVSELNKGSSFDVFLPIYHGEVAIKMKNIDISPQGAGRILLADDEPIIVDINVIFLENLGYTVEVARDGIEALNIFQDKPDYFDLIITDQTMPRMTGAELAKVIREIRPALPIILCTGFSPDISEDIAMEIGIKK